MPLVANPSPNITSRPSAAQQDVVAVAAEDGVVAVAGEHDVAAVAGEHDVVAGTGVVDVGGVLGEQHVVAGTARDRRHRLIPRLCPSPPSKHGRAPPSTLRSPSPRRPHRRYVPCGSCTGGGHARDRGDGAGAGRATAGGTAGTAAARPGRDPGPDPCREPQLPRPRDPPGHLPARPRAPLRAAVRWLRRGGGGRRRRDPVPGRRPGGRRSTPRAGSTACRRPSSASQRTLGVPLPGVLQELVNRAGRGRRGGTGHARRRRGGDAADRRAHRLVDAAGGRRQAGRLGAGPGQRRRRAVRPAVRQARRGPRGGAVVERGEAGTAARPSAPMRGSTTAQVPDWAPSVRAATGGRGVDIVVETTGEYPARLARRHGLRRLRRRHRLRRQLQGRDRRPPAARADAAGARDRGRLRARASRP